LIVSRYHLATLREGGIAFEHTEGGKDIAVPPGLSVSYQGQTFPSAAPDLLAFKVKELARVLSEYVTSPEGMTVPYIVEDGHALFVNGDVSFDSGDVSRRGAMLAVCDAVAHFLGAEPSADRPLAMLRLEDVSSLTPAANLERIVRYLAAAHVPYGL